MADLNEARFTGVVPKFENAIVVGNQDNENKAYARLKLNVSRGKNKDGKYVDDLLSFSAFGKTAQWIGKYVKPGAGLIIRARVAGSEVRKDAQGNDLLDANGKKIYTGERLMIENYNGISFVRGGEKNEGGASSAQQASAQQTMPNPMATFQQQAPAQQPAAATAPAGGFDFNDFSFKS